MKKLCVCMVIIYVAMMFIMGKTVLAQDILYITPMIVGVIFVVYSYVLLIRQKSYINKNDEELLEISIEKYENKLQEFISIVDEVNESYACLRHDMANHTQVVMGLVEEKDCQNKEERLGEIIALLEANRKIRFSDNSLINAALWVKFMNMEKLGYKIEKNIELFGLKKMDCRVMCYNIYFLLDMIEKQKIEQKSIFIKMYVKKIENNKARISYKLEIPGCNIKKLIWSHDYATFKELSHVMNGSVICEKQRDLLTLGGWMEVEQNV